MPRPKASWKMLCMLAVLALTGVHAFAATQATGRNTLSPTLVVNVTVQQSVSLTLSTGA